MSDLQDRAAALVNQEVFCCMSQMVSTLSNAYGSTAERGELPELVEQAYNLACSVPDFEEAAHQAGWMYRDVANRGIDTAWAHKDDGAEGDVIYESAEECCNCEGIEWEDYNREVFEHWAVSTWLAEKLISKGEKVDTDFCGLCVWARTTTGQAISSDHVIEQIVKDLIASK